MNEPLLFFGIFVFSVFISSCSQIMLKKSANKEYADKKSEYLNPLVIGAYVIFLLSTLLTVYALRYVPLSLGPLIEALGYLFVGVLSFVILRERVSKRAMLGMAIIIIGIVISTLGF